MKIPALIRTISFKQLKPIHWIFLLSTFMIIHIPIILNDNGHSNTYVLLAKSLCRGKLSLSTKDMAFVKGTKVLNTGDLIYYHEKYYLPYPPAPAFLIIPFMLLGGGTVNSVLIAVLLSCLNILLLYCIFKKLDISDQYLPWLIYGFIFGTGYWFVLLSSHHVYGFAEIVSVTGLLLLFNELFGKKRALLMGLYLGIAFLSRQFTLFMAIFVLGYMIHEYRLFTSQSNHKIFWKEITLFSISLGASILIYFFYNYARFGNPFDTGYKDILFIGVLKERVEQYGVFSSHYVLYNLYNYLFKGFNIEFTGKGFLKIKDVDLYGTALLMASPFLVSFFKTGWNKTLRIFAWATIGIIFTGLLFYHNNGKDQVNTSRFTLDFLPLMLILTGLGAKNIPHWLFKGMIGYAIVVNMLAFGIHFYFHTLPQ